MMIAYLRENLSAGRLGRHLSQNILQTAVETGGRTLTTLIVAGVFQAALFGRLGVLLTLAHFLFSVADGSSAALVKFTAEARARHPRLGAETGWRGACLAALAAAAGGAVIFAGAAAYQALRGGGGGADATDGGAMIALALAYVFGVVWIFKISIEAAFRGLKDFGPPALWALVITPPQCALLIAAVWWGGWRLTGYMALMAAGTFVHTAAVAAHFHWRHRRGAQTAERAAPADLALAADSRASVRAASRYALPLMLRGMVWFFFLKANILIVAAFHPGDETGFVTLADRFLLLPLLVVGAYVNAIAPRMAELGAGAPAESRAPMQRYMSKSNTALLLLMLPFGAAFAALGPALERWMPDFAAVGPMLLVLAPFLAVKAWGGLAMSGALIPGGQARLALGIGVFGAALNLLFNLLLVPPLGAYGSVLGMIAAHTAVSLVAIWFAWRRLGIEFRFGAIR